MDKILTKYLTKNNEKFEGFPLYLQIAYLYPETFVKTHNPRIFIWLKE
jgi:hypothetical protein